jgi:PKD repeat protein
LSTLRTASRYRFGAGIVAVAALGAFMTLPVLPALPAQAADIRQVGIVSADPTNTTPDVLDEPGSVRALTQAGLTIVAGGDFTTVENPGSTTPLTRNRLFSFAAATGQVTAGFAPNVDGLINAVVVSADGQSVFIGGEFKNVNATPRVSLAKVDLATGQLDPTFNQPKLDGRVFSLKLANGKLYISGSFAHIGTTPIVGLAALDPASGALDPTVNVGFAGVHNGGITTIRKIDVTPDGSRLVAVGNFKTVSGLDREQVALIDLTGPSASVANWETNRFKAPCNTDFDTVMHDVVFSPDGAYFVIGTTGSFNYQTLCDASSRWETGATGTALEPTWSNSTGGDTIWSVAVTGTVVYVGGHFRWQNNPYAGDKPGQGAVPRDGLAALDPTTGVPLKWNPGRVLGEGAYDLLPTATGLYVGHDTNFIGNEFHNKLAFFPLAGGKTVPNPSAGVLPGTLYRFGKGASGATSPVLFRVNAGGPQIAAIDTGPAWTADTNAAPSPNHNPGSTAKSWSAITTVSTAVPPSTPKAVFTDERFDPLAGAEMGWHFAVPVNSPVEVRLYFVNQDPATKLKEQRVFDISLDGIAVQSKYDIAKDVGHRVGTMLPFVVTSDGSVDIGFVHHLSDPTISAIEIVTTCGATTGVATLDDKVTSHAFNGTNASLPQPVFGTAGTAWSQTRGAFMLSGSLYTGWADGHLCRRTYDGSTFGPQRPINLYNNKVAGTKNNVGAGSLAHIGGMFFSNNRLFYTVKSKASLFYRAFSPQSDILGAPEFVATPNVAGVTFGQVNGMFLSLDPNGSGKTFLYFTQGDTGNLSRMVWNGTAPVAGTAVVLSGPTKDAIRWEQDGLALFVGAGAVAPNVKPHASIGSKCTGLACDFTGAGSGDQDGTIVSYSWAFGDGGVSTSPTPSHEFAAEGSYVVKLTVTDNQGATASTTRTVSPAPINELPVAEFTVTCSSLSCHVDGTASDDPDGSITDYSWTFGDGGTASGSTADHTYAAAGGYTITLSVTDDRLGTGTASHNVNVVLPTTAISFLGADAVNSNAQSWTVHVPAAVASGDVLILAMTSNSTTVAVSGPGAGWVLLQAPLVAGSSTTTVWKRVAAASDSGAAVTLSAPGTIKVGVSVLAYRGTSATNPVSTFAAVAEPTTGTTHTTPTVTVPTNASWVLSLWTEKSSGTTVTPPPGQTPRVSSLGSGSSHMSALFTDNNAPVNAGSAGGLTMTSDASGKANSMWTIVLAPGP